MKIKLLLIGKTVDKNLIKLIDEYQSRIKRYIPYEVIVIPELKNRKKMTVEQQKTKEAELVFSKINGSDDLILLDERGNTFTSVEFSGFLEKKCCFQIKVWFLLLEVRMVFQTHSTSELSCLFHSRQ